MAVQTAVANAGRGYAPPAPCLYFIGAKKEVQMNSVFYEQNGKYAVVDGIRFCRDDKTGYYLNSTLKLRLHRYVYERAYGTIPTGYEVHHIDHNRNNNEPENLKLVTVEEHKRIHGNDR